MTEIHGRQGLVLTLPAAITFTVSKSDGTDVRTITADKVGLQFASLKDTGGTSVVAASDNIVKAGRNYFLLHGDGRKGVHNPSFFAEVVRKTMKALP